MYTAQFSYKFTIKTCFNELAWYEIMMHTGNTLFKHVEHKEENNDENIYQFSYCRNNCLNKSFDVLS